MFHIDGIEENQLGTLSPSCIEVLHYWQRHAERVGGIPKLTDIDLMDIWQHASHITIKDVEPSAVSGSMRLRFRYAGTMIHELTGHELTGRYMDDVYGPADEIHDTQMRVVTSGNPHYWKRILQNTSADWESIAYESLTMPLKGNTGAIAHILTMISWPEEALEDAGSGLHSKDRYKQASIRSGGLKSRNFVS